MHGLDDEDGFCSEQIHVKQVCLYTFRFNTVQNNQSFIFWTRHFQQVPDLSNAFVACKQHDGEAMSRAKARASTVCVLLEFDPNNDFIYGSRIQLHRFFRELRIWPYLLERIAYIEFLIIQVKRLCINSLPNTSFEMLRHPMLQSHKDILGDLGNVSSVFPCCRKH